MKTVPFGLVFRSLKSGEVGGHALHSVVALVVHPDLSEGAQIGIGVGLGDGGDFHGVGRSGGQGGGTTTLNL